MIAFRSTQASSWPYSCIPVTRFRRYLFAYFTWKTLSNHVFEDLRKPKAPTLGFVFFPAKRILKWSENNHPQELDSTYSHRCLCKRSGRIGLCGASCWGEGEHATLRFTPSSPHHSDEGCIHNTQEQAEGASRTETGVTPFALVSQTKTPHDVYGPPASPLPKKGRVCNMVYLNDCL
jgi:hypothetical protein